MAILTVTATHDYSADPLLDITDIVFTAAAQANFNAAQFDGTHISSSVHIDGDANSNTIYVFMAAPATFSMVNWTFNNNFDTFDSLIVDGSSGADTITASGISHSVFISGLGGADTLTGGLGDDLFSYGFASDVAAGESIDGKGGFDFLSVSTNGVSYDFTVATITGVEGLLMGGNPGSSGTSTFTGAQIGAGAIADIRGSNTTTDTLIVVGSSVDLTGVAFTFWTNGTDTIKIIGTVGADSLKGSDQNDIITGGRGKDVMFGGDGADVFDFNLTSESKRGSTHDVILDFHHGEHDRIDLRGIDAIMGGKNNAFHFIKATPFHHKAGELHYVKHGTLVTVEGDTNGDGKADFQIEVHGASHLLSTDFIP